MIEPQGHDKLYLAHFYILNIPHIVTRFGNGTQEKQFIVHVVLNLCFKVIPISVSSALF